MKCPKCLEIVCEECGHCGCVDKSDFLYTEIAMQAMVGIIGAKKTLAVMKHYDELMEQIKDLIQ